MKPLFSCELEYFSSPHLSQIYDGFQKLAKAGVISLSVKPTSGDETKPLLVVRINDKHTVVYDTLDGLNWLDNVSLQENLSYFKNHVKADYYFKRSFNSLVSDNAPEACYVHPLGLNYSFSPEGKFPMSAKESVLHALKSSSLMKRFYTKLSFSSKDFEYYPVLPKEKKIVFLARLWNPDDVEAPHLREERERINKNRIDCIRACREEFGDRFIGGVQDDVYSRRYAPDFIVPFSLTRREAFLRVVKESAICVATTGLHDSIGWKFGEYVAASRAIISEPLKYELPGDFIEGENYLSYKDKDELVELLKGLLSDERALLTMMHKNFRYYNDFLRPDMLVLNTLLRII